MSNYVQNTNFATKDALPSGDSLKIVRGTEINTEFNNIATAVATKADLLSPTFTGTPSLPTGTIAVTQSVGNNTTAVATTAFVQAVKESLHPVGSIYINAGVTTNPATLLGFGTWVAFGAGRVMVGLDGGDTLFDALEEAGGSKNATLPTHTHTATTTSVDSGHFHGVEAQNISRPIFSGLDARGGSNVGPLAQQTTLATANITSTTTVASAGSSATNANLQPYITVAMWKRTA